MGEKLRRVRNLKDDTVHRMVDQSLTTNRYFIATFSFDGNQLMMRCTANNFPDDAYPACFAHLAAEVEKAKGKLVQPPLITDVSAIRLGG